MKQKRDRGSIEKSVSIIKNDEKPFFIKGCLREVVGMSQLSLPFSEIWAAKVDKS